MKLVQIGANSGKDAVYKILEQNQEVIELAILVEPIPFILEDLKKQYRGLRNIAIENIAISHTKLDTFTLYYEENSNYEVSSFSKQHILDHGCLESKIKSIDVPCLTLNELLEKYKLTTLDYLYIDTEGLDVHIIASIDYSKYIIKNIIFEATHTDGANKTGTNYYEIAKYLTSLGYNLSQHDNLNIKASL